MKRHELQAALDQVKSDLYVINARLPALPLRKIQRVNFVRLPVFRPDGRLELLPKGYDEQSGILTMKDCLDYPLDWDAKRACLFLDDFLKEWPFLNPRSQS